MIFGAPGVGLQLDTSTTNAVTLAAGQTATIPSGRYFIVPGPYTFVQFKDPVTGSWRGMEDASNSAIVLNSDGQNFRLANLTGCIRGALITNAGSGYTSAPTVTVSGASSAAFTAIVGGAVNTTVTVGAAGAGYNHAPQVIFSTPNAGGVAATGYATVSGGAVASVVVDNQGAGYGSAPTITLVADPRDSVTTQAVATATLTGAGTVTAVLATDHGVPVTAVPTLTFTGGGGANAAATAVMCFAATGLTVGAGGAGYGNAQPFSVKTTGGTVAGTPAILNPSITSSSLVPRQADMTGASTSGGAVTATGLVLNDAGLFQAVPSAIVLAGGSGLATTVATATVTVGGVIDRSLIQPC